MNALDNANILSILTLQGASQGTIEFVFMAIKKAELNAYKHAHNIVEEGDKPHALRHLQLHIDVLEKDAM